MEAIASQSYIGDDGGFSHGNKDGDRESDLDCDFDMDENYAVGTKPLITYSATIGSQRVIHEDERHQVIYTARCGMQVPAVFHDQIRVELIAIAGDSGAYAHRPTEGTEATDISAFHPDQKNWQEKGENRPNVLKRFAKPENFANPEYNVGFMYFDGLLVIDHESQPLRAFQGIPLTLSSKLEGWRAEAIRRLDPRIRNMDLIGRMPVKVEASANGIPTREPLVKVNAMAGRQSRFREQAGAIIWAKTTTDNVHDFLWSLLPQHCRDNNLALPRDLTQQERGRLRALNLGKHPERARKVPDADKGVTREQYIDGVHRRAAGSQGPRGGEARRHRKESVRRAIREARADTLSDAPATPQVQLELSEDVVAASHVPQQPIPDFAVASAAPVLTTALAAPAASTALDAPVTSAAAAPPAAPQLRTPLVRGLVEPPLAFVRPGQYLYDEPMIFSYRWNAFSHQHQ